MPTIVRLCAQDGICSITGALEVLLNSCGMKRYNASMRGSPKLAHPPITGSKGGSAVRLRHSLKKSEVNLILEEKLSIFALFPAEYDVICGLFINGLYYVEEHSFYTQFAESFYHEMILSFVKCFLYIY